MRSFLGEYEFGRKKGHLDFLASLIVLLFISVIFLITTIKASFDLKSIGINLIKYKPQQQYDASSQ